MAAAFLGYAKARAAAMAEEKAFRIYVTEALRLRGENKYLTQSWLELITPSQTRDFNADEIVEQVVMRGGLVVTNEPTRPGG